MLDEYTARNNAALIELKNKKINCLQDENLSRDDENILELYGLAGRNKFFIKADAIREINQSLSSGHRASSIG